MASSRPSARSQEGFTIVELLVAAFILVVGMAGLAAMTVKGSRETSLNRQRVRATNLARELTEAARSADYADLNPAQLGTVLAAKPSLAGTWSPSASGAMVGRVGRGATTYTVTATVCAYDDPKDQLAATAPDNPCSTAVDTTGKPDRNGDDFRRVRFVLTWTARGRTRTVQQTALVVNPSGGLGPRITDFTQTPAKATILPGGTAASFLVTTTRAAAVHWNADDGVSNDDAVPNAGDTTGTKWRLTWDLGIPSALGSPRTASEVLDGTYTIGAQAFDDRNIAGESRVQAVAVNRRVPYPVEGARGAHNTRDTGWIDLEWSGSPERDVIGYRVYWAGADGVVGGGDDAQVCPGVSASPGAVLAPATTSCIDATPRDRTKDTWFYVVAVDRDNGTPAQLRQGEAARFRVVQATSTPSAPVVGPTATTTDGLPTVSWSLPTSGGTPAGYRIYRDGTGVDQRIASVVGSSTSYQDRIFDNVRHEYHVTALDATGNESRPAGPQVWTP